MACPHLPGAVILRSMCFDPKKAKGVTIRFDRAVQAGLATLPGAPEDGIVVPGALLVGIKAEEWAAG